MVLINLNQEKEKAEAILAGDKTVMFEFERTAVRNVKESKESEDLSQKEMTTHRELSPREKLQKYLKEIGQQ